VPVGSFLSGGLDSSLISAIITRQRRTFQTFSIGFEDESYDEVPFSKKVAEHINTRHNVEYLTIDEQLMSGSSLYGDEPFGDASFLADSFIVANDAQICHSLSFRRRRDEVLLVMILTRPINLQGLSRPAFVRLCRPLIDMLPPSEKKTQSCL